ncbi:MAG: class I SAM-dependent methyltransferase, partial [Candidatus Hermodarchaeota archaeon]
MENHLKASNKKNKIIKSYNSSAHFYDKRYRIIQEKKYARTIDKHIITEKKVLDNGCGTGLLFEFITKSKINNGIIRCNYVAIDISRKMLREFKLKLSKLKEKIHVFLILSDIENLP